MGGSTKEQTSTTKEQHEPWAPAMPALGQILSDAKTLYDGRTGPGVYLGDRVAGFGADTQAGMNAIRDSASAGPSQGVKNADGFVTGLLGSGGMSAGTRGALDDFMASTGGDLDEMRGFRSKFADGNAISGVANDLMSGRTSVNTEGDLRGLLGRALAPSSAETNLSDVASGKYLDPKNANPYLDALIKTGADSANKAVQERFAASGRYGSGNFAGAIAKATGDIETSTRADQYEKERARQVEATGAIDTARQTGTSLGRGILGDISSVQGTNANLRLAGANLQSSRDGQEMGLLNSILSGDMTRGQTNISTNQTATAHGLQAAGLLPMLESQKLAPAQSLMAIGGMDDALRQTSLDSQQQIYNEINQAPWDALGRYAGFATSIGGMGGQSTKVETKPVQQPGIFQSLLGGASSIAGLLGKFIPSDERLKENVKEVGELHDGQPIYAYNYKGDGTPQIGLLAQEVAQREPDAVGVMPGGLLAVDYGRATAAAARRAPKHHTHRKAA